MNALKKWFRVLILDCQIARLSRRLNGYCASGSKYPERLTLLEQINNLNQLREEIKE